MSKYTEVKISQFFDWKQCGEQVQSNSSTY